jgi:hypothetical protein
MDGKRKEKKRVGMKKAKKRNSLFLLRIASFLKGKQKSSLSLSRVCSKGAISAIFLEVFGEPLS